MSQVFKDLHAWNDQPEELNYIKSIRFKQTRNNDQSFGLKLKWR